MSLSVIDHKKVLGGIDGFKLTRREKEIAALVILGRSNREIADQLFIDEMTVKVHMKNIFGKLEIRRRGEIASKALDFNLSWNHGATILEK